MQKQLTKQALVSLFTSSLAAAAIGQDRGAALASVPEYSDDPSGWVRIEVAIFEDSDTAALNAEIWEHAPKLGYPQGRRWLTRYDEIKALMDEYGESAVTVNADGSVDVVPEPVIKPVIEVAQEDSDALLNADVPEESAGEIMDDAFPEVRGDSGIGTSSIRSIDELEAIAGPDTSSSLEIDTPEPAGVFAPLPEDKFELSDNANIMLNGASAGPSSDGSRVSMEELLTDISTESRETTVTTGNIVKGDSPLAGNTEVVEDDVDAAAIDEVDIFKSGDPANASAQFDDMTSAFSETSSLPSSDINWLDDYAVDNEEDVQNSETMAPEEAPPTLPTPYQALTVEMLKQGLDKLQQQTDRAPVTALAWLQAPGDSGLPIVLDAWQQGSDLPVIQGTLTFTRDEEAVVTVDMWLNTAGDYLPPRFEATAPPLLPERVLVIETPPTDQGPVQESERPEFIDLRTGLNTDGLPSGVDKVDATVQAAERTSSAYRHAITVSEQRDVREGYVRYIDHPTLQVIATWRELSFKEVYELGESQRIRRGIDSLTRTLTATPNTGAPRPQADPESTHTIVP
jgi:hypothetical protein